MTVLVITKTYTRGDLAIIFPAPGIDLVLLKTIAETEAHPGADACFDLDFINEESRVKGLSRLLPVPVIVNAVVPVLQEIGRPFVRINGWPGFLERNVHELSVPDAVSAGQVADLYGKLGRAFHIVPDVPGMISSRILATIINEAYYTWEEKVSTKEEIDIAMKLGTNYPLGPFEWSRRIGLEQIAGLLEVLSKTNARYTPALSLQKEVEGLKYD